ncbi:hypothetical protein GCM10009819_07410 [Agromyces tropicus]|uniref:Uncharacterized protein n=1 Tax=Agromyces tropicus TaxID=555371 RepID=A0ABN2U1L3_9MICO
MLLGQRHRSRSIALGCAITLGATLIAGASIPALAAGETQAPTGVEVFQNPPTDAKPMARMWFPDGGAGATEEGRAQVADEIRKLAEGGYGGVEIQYLADSGRYNNAEAAEFGFGSPNWQRVLKTILATANSIEDGFKIDITITSHWPPVVNTIDPNDDDQQKQATQAYAKITQEALDAGSINVPVPAQRVKDFSNTSSLIADFLSVDELTGVAIARVKSVTNNTPQLELVTLADLTDSAEKRTVTAEEIESGASYRTIDGVDFAGYPGGIPDEEYAAAKGLNYADILAKFGPEPSDPDFDGKIDEDGNRKRLADWQFLYSVDVDAAGLGSYSPSAGAGYAVGDYVIIGNYFRGTAQIMSGGESVTMKNRTYATDYFREEGVQRIFDFWSDNILDDELRALLLENAEANGASIFEDSIEVNRQGPIWTADLLDEIEEYKGYDAQKYASVLSTTSTTLFDDSSAVTRLREDYNLTLGKLFEEEHAAPISEWASEFGYDYRAQAYSLTGLDIAAAAAAVDIPEGDNSTAGDGLRTLAGAVNLTGKKFLSMESFTDGNTTYSATWLRVLKANNRYISSGVNRNILHGTPYRTAFNGNASAWPGWTFRGTYGAFSPRQAYWEDFDQFAGYLSRTQAVMQSGTADVDFVVLQGTNSSFSLQGGNSLSSLLNVGYSYNIISPSLLNVESAVVSDGVLAADGPSYKALVMKDATTLDVASVRKLNEYAEGGLPVALLNSNVTRVYGTSAGGNTDASLLAELAELTDRPNVKVVANQNDLLTWFREIGVASDVAYDTPNLQASKRVTEEADYFYFYNGNQGTSPNNSPRVTAGPVSSVVTLDGVGVPFELDATTGEVTPIAEYSIADGATTLEISVEEEGAKIIALAKDADAFPTAPTLFATASSGGTVRYEDGAVRLAVTEPGTYTVDLSDGGTTTVDVQDVAQPIDLASGWDLEIQGFGPDAAANTVDPTVSKRTTVSFDDVALQSWSALPATPEQLSALGVAAMNKVSGIGTYTRTFTLPDDWSGTDGARLRLTHGWDMVTGVSVNGESAGAVSQWTNAVDIGDLLHAGENSIEIKVDTTLASRVSNTIQAYGLTAAIVTPTAEALVDLALDVAAQSKCTGARAVVTVTAENTDDFAFDVEFSTPYGDKAYDDPVKAGKSVSKPFSTQKGAIEAGAAVVTASAEFDGISVVTERSAEFEAATCK